MIWNLLQYFYFCFVRWTSWTCIKANDSPPPTQHRFQYNDEKSHGVAPGSTTRILIDPERYEYSHDWREGGIATVEEWT